MKLCGPLVRHLSTACENAAPCKTDCRSQGQRRASPVKSPAADWSRAAPGCTRIPAIPAAETADRGKRYSGRTIVFTGGKLISGVRVPGGAGRGGSAGRWLPDGVSCGGRCSAAARRGAEGRHGRPARAGGPLELSAARPVPLSPPHCSAGPLLGSLSPTATATGRLRQAALLRWPPPCTATTAAADTATSAAAPDLSTEH